MKIFFGERAKRVIVMVVFNLSKNVLFSKNPSIDKLISFQSKQLLNCLTTIIASIASDNVLIYNMDIVYIVLVHRFLIHYIPYF